MARIKSSQRVIEYTTEFKSRVVALTNELDVDTARIAEIMGLHPVMVYRWRQEHRAGSFIETPSRRISMTKPAPKSPTDTQELKRLKRENEKLKKENAFLKKWDGYLKAKKQSGSRS